MAWRGEACPRANSVRSKGTAASLSWRPPRCCRRGARYGPASPACAAAGSPGACGRTHGGFRSPQGPGGAWPRSPDLASRALTATAWSCCGEGAGLPPAGRSGSRPKGTLVGAAGLGADLHLPCVPQRVSSGVWGSEATGAFTLVTNLWQNAFVCHLARALTLPNYTLCMNSFLKFETWLVTNFN